MNSFRSFFSTTAALRSTANMSAAATKVQSIIDDNAVVVFSKSWCSYSRNSKSTLQRLGADFKVFELDRIPEGQELQDGLEELTGQYTVPNIYIQKKHVGGNSDLQRLSAQGKLQPLLKQAGVLKA